tara:strand:- start:206779 stop:207039 length:261 start_codon:yes stop_codon:yes gene_type:complete
MIFSEFSPQVTLQVPVPACGVTDGSGHSLMVAEIALRWLAESGAGSADSGNVVTIFVSDDGAMTFYGTQKESWYIAKASCWKPITC